MLTWIEAQSPFVQGLLGSAVFALSLWLLSRAKAAGLRHGGRLMTAYTELMVIKHIVHKHFVRSSNAVTSTNGMAFAMFMALRFSAYGGMVATFFYFLDSMLNAAWLHVAGAWVLFNCLLEAHTWVRDSTNSKLIAVVDSTDYERIKAKTLPQLSAPQETVEGPQGVSADGSRPAGEPRR